MSEYLATALGLFFTLVVCLLAMHALLGPWLRLRRAPAALTGETDAQNGSGSSRPAGAHMA